MKKRKLMYRVAAVLCALVVAVGSLGMSEAYYAREVVFNENGEGFLCSYSSNWIGNIDLTYSDEIIACFSEYKYYIVYESAFDYRILFSDSKPYLSYSYSDLDNGYSYMANFMTPGDHEVCYEFSKNDLVWSSADTSVGNSSGLFYIQDFENYDYYRISNYKIYDLNFDLCFESGAVFLKSMVPSEFYNSSLGYLQNVKRQTLYLENDNYDPVFETLKYQFSFDKNTTSGLDITDGNWSVRHYMQVEVKNAKKDYETVEIYDKVFMNEYPAADCKVGYMFKDSIETLYKESGFDSFTWWESEVLGYIAYHNDYFQLVRTNDDGSVEYGGFVKVWQDEYNINHSATLNEDESQDNNGYNDNIVSGSHGSGDSYEDAEHDAGENESNSSNIDSDFSKHINDMVSMVSAVPQLFGAMFSFLPDWCLNFLAAGVGFSVILLIWKSARG